MTLHKLLLSSVPPADVETSFWWVALSTFLELLRTVFPKAAQLSSSAMCSTVGYHLMLLFGATSI